MKKYSINKKKKLRTSGEEVLSFFLLGIKKIRTVYILFFLCLRSSFERFLHLQNLRTLQQIINTYLIIS